MPITTTKLTISVPNALLERAEKLGQPGEGRSALFTRLLDDAIRAAEEAAIDAEYERAYPADFTWSDEQQRLHASLDKAQAEAIRAQLNAKRDG